MAILISTLPCTAVYAATAINVWVVTDSQHPVHGGEGARIIDMDAPARIEAALSHGLPADPRTAAIAFQQRLARDGGTQTKDLADVYQGVVEAWSLGIAKLPAVIVDRRYVVYGDSDVAHAVSRIQTYREAHP